MSCAGLLLAAGRGRRFGAADKLLAPLPDGRPVALQSALNLQAAVADLLVVVRPDAAALQALLDEAGIATAVCPDADRGMGHSLRFAVGCRAEASGWLIALADMPWIAPATIAALAEALCAGGGIVAPRCDGRQGHPVGFAAQYYAELRALGGDRGAQSIIARNASALRLIDVADRGVLRDVDGPQDLPG